MLRQPLVFLLVALEVLFRAALHPAGNKEVVRIGALQHEELLSVGDDLRVVGGDGRMAEGEEIDGVEHVGLSHAVLADQTVDLRRQLQRCGLDILIVDERQFLKNHSAKVLLFWSQTVQITRILTILRKKTA